MHMSSVLTSWGLQVGDVLAAAADNVGADLREIGALNLIEEHPGASVEWARLRIGLTQSGTVRLLDRLQNAGWVTRTRAGRSVGLRVAPAGRRLLRRWRRQSEDAVARLLGGLDEGERERLVELLSRALRAMPRDRLIADATCRACNWRACGEDCPVNHSVRSLSPG